MAIIWYYSKILKLKFGAGQIREKRFLLQALGIKNIKKNTTANSNGVWSFCLKTLGYKNGGQSIMVTGKNTVAINNILFGEVWFCSGQSNMELTIKNLGDWNSEWYGKDKEILDTSDYSQIRLFTIGKSEKEGKQNDCSGAWKKANATTIEEFSATAWFFGLKLYQELGIPIGLINSAWERRFGRLVAL